MPKRQRGGISQGLGAQLIELYGGLGPEFLWDPTSRLELLWPEARVSATYLYIGRENAQKLFSDVKRMQVDQVRQILGAKGSGKRTVMATIAAYLHGRKERDVVYVSGQRFVSSPLYTLREALLLCSSAGNLLEDGEEEGLLEIGDIPSLVEWCTDRSLLMVVDDWDKIEKSDGDFKQHMEEAARGNSLIKISSVNSRERYAWETSDKADDYIFTSEFDGPYTEMELQTWLAHSDLPQGRLDMLEYYTGGMPRLLRFYSECADDGSYMEKIYTNKLAKDLARRLTTKMHVEAAMRLVTSSDGVVIPPELDGMKLTCFYKKGYCYRILSPYLRQKAEEMIVDAGVEVEKKLQVADLQVWLAAIRLDLQAPVEARNSARLGWNVEGATIGAIRVQGQVLPGDTFETYVTYRHGKELEALSFLKESTLKNGVLLGPASFNEKAVDIVYIKLVGNKMKIIAIQITVAQWKARQRKKSHETWRKDVLPTWETGFEGVEVESSFLYVMPEQVKLEDVPDVEATRFGTICPRLFFLNGLNLETPKAVKKAVRRKCSGVSRDGETPCGNTSCCPGCVTSTDTGFCACSGWRCYHHK